MSEQEKRKPRLEIGHVLFIDIVGYSKLLIEEQRERLAELTKIVLSTATVRASTDEQLVPFWDPLCGDPRFEKIVESLAPKDN